MRPLGIEAFVVLALLSASSVVHAQSWTYFNGEKLNIACSSLNGSGDSEAAVPMLCIGYVAAVWDTGPDIAGVGPNRKRWPQGHVACVPSGYSLAEITQTVARWVREHTEYRAAPGAFAVAAALQDTWPCPDRR